MGYEVGYERLRSGGQCPASDWAGNETVCGHRDVGSNWFRPRTPILCLGSWENQPWCGTWLLLLHSL